ncbi:sensor domain-containing diguanylate cyclase [Exiguobacterium antarcticum]|uniref:Sensor domain-containing diguanylate cyclase n=1 Tax=Exiguobacterium antarcticum TaxID=132920 RepID=A0ABT6R2P3_9BACL|nr:sensor domain-containing diguanylate cyclase [Exiguobacterium antarcticum]MDI3235208.1 sensor domain-containing diguanylate cyclase [Exiguobacterium antarcticum]
MNIQFEELKMYTKFDDLAEDLLNLAKEILPEQLFYLSVINESEQLILKLSNDQTSMRVTEGMVIDLNYSLCQRIDFQTKQPLVYEDVTKEPGLVGMKELLEQANVRSYLGIPISLTNGEKFGTLCAINDEASLFGSKSIELLQRIVRLFSYYLELERFVWRDTLTDLYNRRYLMNRFDMQPHEAGALFFLDLDGFKKINDVYGHDAGDTVLQEVARRLQSLIAGRTSVCAVRLGGDEFVLHFACCDSQETLVRQADEILACLSKWDAYDLSASIGIVSYTAAKETSLKNLLRQADIALYEAKSSGKNRYKWFNAQQET